MTIVADDTEAPALASVVVVARAGDVGWNFRGHGYTLRRLSPRFRYDARRGDAFVGVDYLGTGVEMGEVSRSATGGARGSLAMATAPCATTTSGAVSRGVGRVTLKSSESSVSELCPADDGRLAAWTTHATTWNFTGIVGGDRDFRGAQLLVVDAPLT